MSTVDLEPAQAAALRSYGDVTLDVRGRARDFRWQARILPLGPATLIHNDSEGQVVLAGTPARYVVTLPEKGHWKASFGGAEAIVAPGANMVVYSPTQSASLNIVGGIRARGTVIDARFLEAQLQALTGETIKRPPTFSLEISTSTGDGAWFRQLVHTLHRLMDENVDALATPPLVTSLTEAVTRALLVVQPHDYLHLFERSAPPTSRNAVRLAEEYIDAHASDPIQIADLANVTGTSLRALEAAFLSQRRMTPAAFLRQRRLELAHRLLLSEPGAGIVRAAHIAGFLNKPAFEAAYFKKFGELPVQTARRGHMTTDSNRTTKALPSIEQPASVDRPQVLVVDGDSATRRHSTLVLRQAGYDVESFDVAEALVSAPGLAKASCVVVDLHLPEGESLVVQRALAAMESPIPLVFLSRDNDVRLAVEVMRSGAFDVLVEPIEEVSLLDTVKRAVETQAKARAEQTERDMIKARFEALSPREFEVCERIARGQLNKQIAADLGLSEATVKFHRSRAMERLGISSAAELASLFAKAGQIPK